MPVKYPILGPARTTRKTLSLMKKTNMFNTSQKMIFEGCMQRFARFCCVIGMPIQSYGRCARTSKIDLKSITYKISYKFRKNKISIPFYIKKYWFLTSPHTVHRAVSACLYHSKTLQNASYICQFKKKACVSFERETPPCAPVEAKR